MKLIQNSEVHVFESGNLLKSSTVNIMPRIHCLGPQENQNNSGHFARYVRKLKLRYRFRQEFFSKQLNTCFEIWDPTNASTVDYLP